MFILAAKPTVLWPVHFRAPQDGGGFEEHVFKARFNLPVDQAEVEDLFRRIEESRRQLVQQLMSPGKPAEAAEGFGAADRYILDKYWAGWPDGEVKDGQGAVIPYGPETRAALLAIPGMRVALVRAFMETLGGNAETKNSRPLSTTG